MSKTFTNFLCGTDSTSQTLTASYVAGDGYGNTGGKYSGTLIISYTPAANLRNAYAILQFSYDGGTNWYDYARGEDATGATGEKVTTVFTQVYCIKGTTAGETYTRRFEVPLGDGGFDEKNEFKPCMTRLKVKEDGTTDFGTIKAVFQSFDR